MGAASARLTDLDRLYSSHDRAAGAVAGFCVAPAAPRRHRAAQSLQRARLGSDTGGIANRLAGDLSWPPGMADARWHWPNALSPVREPAPSSALGNGRAVDAQPAHGLDRLLSSDDRRRRHRADSH